MRAAALAALCFYHFRNSSGSLAIFAAIRRASTEKHDLNQRRGRVCVQVFGLERQGALILLEKSNGRT
jgi:hypothetical protein